MLGDAQGRMFVAISDIRSMSGAEVGGVEDREQDVERSLREHLHVFLSFLIIGRHCAPQILQHV